MPAPYHTLSPLPISELVNELKNTRDLGLIVNEGFPLNTINLDIHNPHDEFITLCPAKVSNKFTRYRQKVLGTARSQRPSLNLNHVYTHIHTIYLLLLKRLKTLQLVINRKIYKLTSCN